MSRRGDPERTRHAGPRLLAHAHASAAVRQQETTSLFSTRRPLSSLPAEFAEGAWRGTAAEEVFLLFPFFAPVRSRRTRSAKKKGKRKALRGQRLARPRHPRT